MDAHPLSAPAALWHDRGTMEPGRAREIAERLHLGDREEDGTPVIRHVQRVASTATEEARAVAWLHEVLEWAAVTERELLIAGLTGR
jgi:(p)ppGpp synthase/HD superfamily hydrolase